jgi:hypothetical protein
MDERFSIPVVDILRAGGWFDGRNVSGDFDLPSEFAVFPKALDVLSEFGHLHFGECGPGIDCATSDVEINPSAAIHLASDLKDQERILNTRLYPLGEVHRRHGYVLIDEHGRTYLLGDELSRFASTFDRALELLLLGRKPDPAAIARAWS